MKNIEKARKQWHLRAFKFGCYPFGREDQTRPLSSKEAFEKILDYLKKLILDIPAYELQIMKTFGSNVAWEYDQGESTELRRLSEGFSVNALSYDKFSGPCP